MKNKAELQAEAKFLCEYYIKNDNDKASASRVKRIKEAWENNPFSKSIVGMQDGLYIGKLINPAFSTSDNTSIEELNKIIEDLNIYLILKQITQEQIEDIKEDKYLILDLEGITRIPNKLQYALICKAHICPTQYSIEIKDSMLTELSPSICEITDMIKIKNCDVSYFSETYSKAIEDLLDNGLSISPKKEIIEKMKINSEKERNKEMLSSFKKSQTTTTSSSNQKVTAKVATKDNAPKCNIL